MATHAADGRPPLVLNNLDAGSTDVNAVNIYRRGTRVGRINTTDTATSFLTSSDYRLKMDVTPMSGALALVQRMRPVDYLWINGRKPGSGFIAHELQAVFSDAVSGAKDAVDSEGNPDYQSVDYSKLVPTLVSAMQEQQTLIEALQARLTSAEQSLKALQPPAGQTSPQGQQ
jgi:hypothetical protein